MNYYEHHLGDWAAATLHLSFVEDAAYSRLIRKIYSTERPIPGPLDQAQRLVGARTKDEREAVVRVLEEFFRLEADGWHNARCDAELAKFKEGEPEREAKKANEDTRLRRHREERATLFVQLTAAGQHAPWNLPIADLRERVKAIGAATSPATAGPQQPATLPATAPATPATATHTPDTNHQSPEEKKGRKRPASFDAAGIDLPAWLEADVWQRWCADRKARGKPITEEGARGQLKRLDEYRKAGTTPASVLEHAIASGNQGLYPPPAVNGRGNGQKSFRQTDSDTNAASLHKLTGGLLGRRPNTPPQGDTLEMQPHHDAIDSD